MIELDRVLVDLVGEAHVLTDPTLRQGYETDWTGRYRARHHLSYARGSRDEVAAVLRACFEARVPVVPQGGNTELVGCLAMARCC